MSFILDALRKSEARRRAGEVPDLHSSQDDGRYSRRRWRRPFRHLLWVVPLFLVIGGVGAYLTQPGWLPLVPQQEPAAPVADVADEELADPEQALADARSADAIDTLDEAPEEAAEPETADVTEDRRRRSPPRASERDVSRPAVQRERIVTDHDDAMAEIERQAREVEQRARDEATEETTEETRPEDLTPATDEPEQEIAEADPDVDEAAVEALTETTDGEWRPSAAEYVRAWELPLSVRRELPDLNLSIHVFSPEEGSRFVLINGERYVPGDRLADGARLVDIRREGAIVDFREHRFLLEP
ncbi:general secretion pathway protein GspB [Wenzhouxiangella sp. AB-CW3]|uniref:general secretion pathway protein GspB n=1 Tax=Wenzhouxiangella sp. AB-CW3 TaxID=2771012 RepID=UPI00168A6557|nr:general secretion pathway protein GspB [Wenzhouxiangella sp. AB-CW3]QOC24022.1 general secretion pathway protein GspB [Wenzhouxiangella sp. AB-CW3]